MSAFGIASAGPVRRMLAYLLDLLIRAGVLLVLGLVVAIALGGSEAVMGVLLICAFVLEWGYYVFFETIGDGRSPGKRALSLRVVKEGGYPIGFIDSVLRNLLRGADFLPVGYLIGLFTMAADSRFRRLGDRVAGTMVVVEERSRVAAPLTLNPPPTARELEGLPAAPATQRLGTRDARALPPARRSDRRPPPGAGADDRARARAADGTHREGSGSLPGAAAPPGRGDRQTARRQDGGRMKLQDDFVAARKQDWDELEQLLTTGSGFRKLPPASIARAASIYRAVSSDLMRAEAAGYSPDVIALLDGLAARAHNTLYSAPPYRLRAAWELIAADFPRTLRRHGRFFALALALFVLPGALGFVGALRSRAFALRLLPADAVEQMEKGYAEGFNKGRGEGTDTAMAGFYVYNNVGIAFRCFATGVFFGLGSAVLPRLQRPGDRRGRRPGDRPPATARTC